MKRAWIVEGGGFRGIAAAHLLARAGHEVILHERAPFLGGVLYSETWDGFVLDKGCHLFDSSNAEIAGFVHEVLDGNVAPVDVRYASRIDGRVADGVAVPDFSGCEPSVRAQIERELVAAAETRGGAAPRTLAEALDTRYGALAGTWLHRAAEKIFRADPSSLAPDALRATAMTRVRIAGDEPSMALKRRSATLDERVAVPAGENALRFYADPARPYGYRNFYPGAGGMRAFCEAAQRHLESLGVVLELGTPTVAIRPRNGGVDVVLADGQTLSADALCWTLDLDALVRAALDDELMQDTVHAVPMVLIYFRVPSRQLAGYTYVHDYDADTRVYRMSAMGEYGRQRTADGDTLACLELPVTLGSPEWDDPEAAVPAAWDEAVAFGFAEGAMPAAHRVLKTPVSYKAPRVGFTAAATEATGRLAALPMDLRWSDPLAFSKKDIFQELRNLLEPG